MRKVPKAGDPMPQGNVLGLAARLYRALYYGWRFKDADAGTELERAMASRHNEGQARWLPFYMLRWAVIGSVLLLIQTVLERLGGASVASAMAMLLLIYVFMYLLLTGIFWAFLSRSGRRSGRRRGA